MVFHFSASSWGVVHERLSSKITNLASHMESHPDIVDLQLMAHSLVDRHRLVNLLNRQSSVVSLFLRMKSAKNSNRTFIVIRREFQLAVATYLRSAIWNWIDLFPHEFNEAIRVHGKVEGAPERVYDLLSSNIPPGQEKIYWPTLSILLCRTSKAS